MTSQLSTRLTYGGTGLKKKRPLKKTSPTSKRPAVKKWAVSASPSGFTMGALPTKVTAGSISKNADSTWNEANLPGLYASLLAWANRNSLQITPINFTMTRYNEWSECYVWSEFKLEYKLRPNNEKYLASHKCGNCTNIIKAGETLCNGCTRFASCDGCYTSGLTLHGVPGATERFCGRCAVSCTKDSCSNLVSPHDSIKECVECTPRAACHICKTIHKSSLLTTVTHKTKKYELCSTCKGLVCESCGIPDRSVVSRALGKVTKKACNECVQKLYDQERKKFEKWNLEELPKGGMLIPSLPERPNRTISIETEFDGNGTEVAKALYRSGLIESPSKGAYSATGSATRRLPCYLKSDSSVSGGELLTYLIDMDNENHAAAVLRMTEVMRGCREVGTAKFSERAGGHIHIDLHSYSIDDLWTLYTTFKFLEAPLYYLGGSGATYGHRTLKGSGYAAPPNGGPFGSKESFASGFRNTGRAGLNLNNFNGAIQQCICGAIVTGDWKKCSCNLGKATAEWRLWNAEINPRILHSWIAIMQAITAYATDRKCDEKNFPYMPWEKTPFKKLTPDKRTKIKSRLEWMHEQLPLTDNERDSLVYAFKQSQLIDLGEKWLDDLLKLKNVSSKSAKDKPRNPSSRKNTKFSLKQNEAAPVVEEAMPAPRRATYSGLTAFTTYNVQAPPSSEYF